MTSLRRFLPVVVALLIACLVLGWNSLAATVPVGMSGQPRSTGIPQGWVVPLWVVGFVWIGLLASAASAASPVYGAVVYCCVLYFLPAHSPAWIYMLWLQLPSLIAAVAVVAWIVHVRAEPELLQNLRRPVGVLGLLVALWYGVTSIAAIYSVDVWRPALQFHPLRAFDALVVFVIAATVPIRANALFAMTASVGIALMVRVAWLQPQIRGDGEIAALATIVGALACGLLFADPRLWRRLSSASLVSLCAVLVWHTQNRAALLAIGAAALIGVLCSRSRWIGAMAMLSIVLLGSTFLLESDYARRFELAFTSFEALAENSRVVTWLGGLQMASANPWVGVGPGHFVHNIGEYAPKYTNHTAHNSLVSAAAETGWLGAALVTSLFVGALSRAISYAMSFRQTSALALAIGIAAYLVLASFLSYTLLAIAYFLMGLTLADESRLHHQKGGRSSRH